MKKENAGGSCSKFKKFQDGDDTALNQAWDTPKFVVLRICTGLTPVKLPLDLVVKSHSSQGSQKFTQEKLGINFHS